MARASWHFCEEECIFGKFCVSYVLRRRLKRVGKLQGMDFPRKRVEGGVGAAKGSLGGGGELRD